MKKISLIIILLSNIFAQTFADTAQRRTPIQQNKLTLIGGLNLGTIEYNTSQINDLVDIQYRAGANLAVEIIQGKIRIGAGFTQQGADLSFTDPIEDIVYSGYDIYNYLFGYGLFSVITRKGFIASAGFQVGKAMDSESELTRIYPNGDMETTSLDIDANGLKLDYGVIVAIDFKIAPRIGIRGSYYVGLGNVAEGLADDFNYKNRSIGINLLYKL